MENSPSNGFGKAGLALSIISLFIGWIPVFGYIGLLLGFIFSFIGIFRSPRGSAIAGLVISICAAGAIVVIYATAGITLAGLGGFDSLQDLFNDFCF